ncbi:hypothetical protein BCV70DRAFT_198792 [Testicularia cyperi]|uniref:Mitochondrial adapter protein MCP1 transmembrane domain-containing protein n=1 Tax=Testicularia cyperi TaxID=1882483 RepID=A0A317XU75_9BASI|nr:hypothetical protein BCV70DRAFT_198792 [Testicularia cyperi]
MQVLGLELRLSPPALVLSRDTQRSTLSVLSRIQTTSAVGLAGFAVVHLSSPLVGLLSAFTGADLGDRVDAVSRWMLLGRVAYQSALGEPLLWASLVAHVASGILKRLVRTFTATAARLESATATTADVKSKHLQPPTTIPEEDDVEDGRFDTSYAATPASSGLELAPLPDSKSDPSWSWSWSWSSLPRLTTAQWSGYLLTPVVLHHVWMNRLLPASSRAPISSLSPSQLDYAFVSYSLSRPGLTKALAAASYLFLTTAFSLHIVRTMPILRQSVSFSWLFSRSSHQASRKKRSSTNSSSSKCIQTLSVFTVLVASVLAITPMSSKGKLPVSQLIRLRYDAVLDIALPLLWR